MDVDRAYGFDLAKIKEEGLMPNPEPNDSRLYRFAGWFIDSNGNGIRDNGETLLPETQMFTADTTLTASFEELPDARIHFHVENGTLESGEESLFVSGDKTWGDIQSSLPVYRAWAHYADDGWYAGEEKMTPGAALTGEQTYTHRFLPDPDDRFDYTVDYKNGDGSIVFKTTTESGAQPIEASVEALAETVPGYTWDKENTQTEPASYAFVPGEAAGAIGSFDENGRFTGRMPGQALAVHYSYRVAAGQTFPLTVRHVTENGVTLKEDKTFHNAEASVAASPADLAGYVPNGFVFEQGKTDEGLVRPALGNPEPEEGYRWEARMPNQPVVLVYKYRGDSGSPHKITERYVDAEAGDAALSDLKEPVVRPGIVADTPVNGTYRQPYGYGVTRPFTVSYAPENPPGADIRFGDGADQNEWSGHMPASDVELIYSHTRLDGLWKKLTYQAGTHGSLTGEGASSDLEPVPGREGAYQASVLINDGTGAGEAAAHTLGHLREKRLLPLPVPEDESLYRFAGWFVDSNHNGIRDGGETLLPESGSFSGETTLTASFEEQPETWMDIRFAAEKAELAHGAPESLHIPTGISWGAVKDRLPAYTIWENYKDGGWYDESGALMTDDKTPVAGQTYTVKGVPDPDKAFAFTTKYTNRDGTVVFQEATAVTQYSIEDEVAAQKLDVPGYVWNREESGTDPSGYPFDPSAGPSPVGTFGEDGRFSGRMPGQALTVFYRYDVAQPEAGSEKPFRLTIRYESENGAEVAAAKTENRNAEEAIEEGPAAAGHYECSGFRFVRGNEPSGMGRPVQGQPDPAAGYAWNAKMPNQDVELIYIYKGKEDESSRFRLTESYVDEEAADPALRDITAPKVREGIPVDTLVDGKYEAPYGYTPRRPFTVETEAPMGTSIGFGTEETKDEWNGPMPAGAVTLTYGHTRDQSKWADLTYLAGRHGSLGAGSGVSPAVISSGAASYKTGVLIDDGSGSNAAYRLEELRKKKLMPVPVAAAHYRFAGWFVDANHNGSLDAGEAYWPEEAPFGGETTLTAAFEEEPGDWLDIHLQVENGIFESGSTSLHVPSDKTWGDIGEVLPKAKAWEHYLPDGWYEGEVKMTSGMGISDGRTYTFRFVPNPEERFRYTVEYTDESGEVIFLRETDESGHPVMEAVHSSLKKVAGYEWARELSGTDPESYPYAPEAGPTQPGAFDGAGGFTGRMPGADLTVRYRYRLKAAASYRLKVEYQTESGRTVHAPAAEETKRPGAALHTVPEEVEGYHCTGFRFVEGKAERLEDGTLLEAVKGEPEQEKGWEWESRMPNQDVRLVYLYQGDESARYQVRERYVNDGGAEGLEELMPPKVSGPYPVDEEVSGRYEQPYGYEKTGQSIGLSKPWDGEIRLSFHPDPETAGDWSGSMPPRDVEITYHHRRSAQAWKDITWLPGRGHGHLENSAGMSAGVQEAGNGAYRSGVLINDGAHEAQSYSLSVIEERKLMPRPIAEPYYRFAGWFRDKNGNGSLDGEETLLEPSQTFTGEESLTAWFEEDPKQWIDIRFAGENAVLNEGERQSLHTTADQSWEGISGSLPSYTPFVNYRVGGWYAGTTKMTGGEKLEKGRTYTFVCYPDPEVFGTNVTRPEAAGGLDGEGKGRVTVYGASDGFYQYLLTDLEGTILKAVSKREGFQRVEFNGLRPGEGYEVYEAKGALPALPGEPVAGLIEEEEGISPPTRVFIPVLEDNYQVSYDEENETEGLTKLLIRPADPDTEYALLDGLGNVEKVPGAGAGGWLRPTGASLQLAGLSYNTEYTVVARPGGLEEITAESRRGRGSVITTDPVGELTFTRYRIEAVGGEILRMGGEEGGGRRYGEVRKGEPVTLRAEAFNESGEAFVAWEAVIGALSGGEEVAPGEEITFAMPASNLVMRAVYEHQPQKASPSQASLRDEVRGGSRKEIALDPGVTAQKEEEVTREKDRELMEQNGASVTYRVIYEKNRVSGGEVLAVKASAGYDGSHEPSFHAAWGLNVTLERYVNGRRVELGRGPATPSDATPSNAALAPEEGEALLFPTYIQLGREDADMMDYQLFEIAESGEGEREAVPVLLMGEPEENGGLFRFEAKAGSRYLMVYSRAYHVSFRNELPLLRRPWSYDMKVRRGEAPSEEAYGDQYRGLPEPEEYLINKKSGAEYRYQGFSYHPSRLRPYDAARGILRTTRLYGNYRDNEAQVAKERERLKEAIEEALRVSGDPFLKRQERKELKEEIREAANVLEQEEPRRALESELREAGERLLKRLTPYKGSVRKGNEEYEQIRRRSAGGGSRGGGGAGRGEKREPFVAEPSRNYTVGTNGNWEAVRGSGGREMTFVLNGGMALRGMWGRLRYAKGEEGLSGWYHFDQRGRLERGWVYDGGKWYYCGEEGGTGRMETGWHRDAGSGRWYYLEPSNGQMITGWREIEGVWYYFEPLGEGERAAKAAGAPGETVSHPQGSLYQKEETPDGYRVNENGGWIRSQGAGDS